MLFERLARPRRHAKMPVLARIVPLMIAALVVDPILVILV